MNPPFPKNQSALVKLTLKMSSIKSNISEVYATQIRSVRDLSLPIWWRHIRNHSCYRDMMLCRFTRLRKNSLVTQFTNSAELLWAISQANTEPFSIDIVESRNGLVKLRNGLGTLLAPAWFSPQTKRSKWTCILTPLNMRRWILTAFLFV